MSFYLCSVLTQANSDRNQWKFACVRNFLYWHYLSNSLSHKYVLASSLQCCIFGVDGIFTLFFSINIIQIPWYGLNNNGCPETTPPPPNWNQNQLFVQMHILLRRSLMQAIYSKQYHKSMCKIFGWISVNNRNFCA